MRFSVIIPVYNARDTLGKCLSSIAAQAFPNFQVLIVNDGSTDQSLSVAAEFAARDDRFRVYSIGHSGPGAARNEGLLRAEGDYVLYMDADDYWVRSDLLQELDKRILAEPADVYMYQMAKITEDGTELKRYTKPPFALADKVVELKEVYRDLVEDGQTLASACNKCVRRSLLLEKEIRFREDVVGEDIDWVLQLFSYARTICLLNLRAYAYIQRKIPTRSTQKGAHNDLVTIVNDWALRCEAGNVNHPGAVAGLVAFQYAICLGHDRDLTAENKRLMRQNTHLLQYGLDRKTRLTYGFFRVFGYDLTAAALGLYLILRRIW